MSEAVERYEGRGGVVNFEDYAMGVESLVRQVALIQNVMDRVMKDGEHYGVIPGTKKPTLLKPGAEKLCMVFRLEPDYAIIREFREDMFIAYTVKCILRHIPTGQTIASGVGSCNSREEKYRYRWIEELTDVEVPKAYWDAKRAGDAKEMKRLIGDGMRPRKNEETGKWVVATSQQVDNDNPWDLDNTIIKMASKRALVAATLNATAASDIFTQDAEDMPEGTVGQDKGQGTKQETGQQQGGMKEPGRKSESGNGQPAKMSEAQQRKVFAQLKQLGVDEEERHGYCGLVLEKVIESLNDLTVQEASQLIKGLDQRIENQKAV
jgi:hypothetical protein